MSWITLPADDATPALERLTLQYTKDGGEVPSIVAAMKPSPKALQAVLRMNYAVTFGGSSLGRETEELIATTVSAINDCFY